MKLNYKRSIHIRVGSFKNPKVFYTLPKNARFLGKPQRNFYNELRKLH